MPRQQVVATVGYDKQGAIINPASGTVPVADGAGGATWQPVGGGGGGAANLSSTDGGASIVKKGSGPNIIVKGFVAGTGISVAETDESVVISASATPPAGAVSISAAGGEVSLVIDGDGPAMVLAGLTAGPGITITPGEGEVIIGTSGETLVSSGGIVSLVSAGTGPSLEVKGLTAGTGIDITEADGAVTIASTAPLFAAGAGISMTLADGVTTIAADGLPPDVTLTSTGGHDSVSLISDGVGPAFALRGLAAGSGISLYVVDGAVTIESTMGFTGEGIDITAEDGAFTFTAPVTSIVSSGGGESLVAGSGVGPRLLIRSLAAGAGMEVVVEDDALTLTNTDPGSAVRIVSSGGATSLIETGAAPGLALRGLTAGAGIAVAAAAGAITLTNTSPASSVTLTSAGGTATLVTDGTGPALTVAGLSAGDGVGLASAEGAVTITNLSPASSVTLTPADGATGHSAVAIGTGPALTIKNFVSGTNVVISESGTGDLMVSGVADMVGVASIAGSGGVVIDMSQPGIVVVDGADVFFPSMPAATWAQSGESVAIAYEENATVPVAVECTPDIAVGFAISEADGVTTFDAGGSRPARRCQVVFGCSVATEPGAAGTLRLFASISGGVAVPLCRCEYKYSDSSATVPMRAEAKLLLSSDDTVQLMSSLTGAAQTIAYSSVYCDIQGLFANS